VSWHNPVAFFIQRRVAASAVTGGFARPDRPPATAFGRSQQRFRPRLKRKIQSQVYQKQPVIRFTKESNYERLRSKHSAIDSTLPWPAENRIFSPKAQ
jgi:hypothetical protein